MGEIEPTAGDRERAREILQPWAWSVQDDDDNSPMAHVARALAQQREEVIQSFTAAIAADSLLAPYADSVLRRAAAIRGDGGKP